MFEEKCLCIKLKELRLEKNLTQKQLATLLKVSVKKISMWENLTASPSLVELCALAYHLDARVPYVQGISTIRTMPTDLPYKDYDNYIKKHEKIKYKK